MYPSPITDENFLAAWEYGCKKYRQGRKKACIRNLAAPLSQFLFLISFLILTYGVFYDGFPGPVRNFLVRIPFMARLWQTISSPLLDGAANFNHQYLGLGLLLYGPALAGAVLCWLLALLFCHPAKPMLSIDPGCRAYDLESLSGQISHYEEDGKKKVVTICGIVYTLILITVCAAFLFLAQEFPQAFKLLQNGYMRATLHVALYCLMAVLCYLILNLPLKLFLHLLSGFSSPRAFHRDAKLYYKASEKMKAREKEASSQKQAVNA